MKKTIQASELEAGQKCTRLGWKRFQRARDSELSAGMRSDLIAAGLVAGHRGRAKHLHTIPDYEQVEVAAPALTFSDVKGRGFFRQVGGRREAVCCQSGAGFRFVGESWWQELDPDTPVILVKATFTDVES